MRVRILWELVTVLRTSLVRFQCFPINKKLLVGLLRIGYLEFNIKKWITYFLLCILNAGVLQKDAFLYHGMGAVNRMRQEQRVWNCFVELWPWTHYWYVNKHLFITLLLLLKKYIQDFQNHDFWKSWLSKFQIIENLDIENPDFRIFSG